ncbi:unnamed protein product [Adineta steineri]|uniref:Uncharacterized protein n=1 Tax=Adineta steineri TaxID=433720 RepID=A0A815LIE2_9BILA|nr:unnamed protein product [Adineta steineri]CAF3757241.1 unnamed protein product [Adineta steineri]
MPHHLNHPFMDAALVGAVGLGAYELWHHHHYGTWGFGNPNKHHGGGGQGGYGSHASVKISDISSKVLL